MDIESDLKSRNVWIFIGLLFPVITGFGSTAFAKGGQSPVSKQSVKIVTFSETSAANRWRIINDDVMERFINDEIDIDEFLQS